MWSGGKGEFDGRRRDGRRYEGKEGKERVRADKDATEEGDGGEEDVVTKEEGERRCKGSRK